MKYEIIPGHESLTNNITSYESYLLASSEKNTARHSKFDRFGIALITPHSCHIDNAMTDMLSRRKCLCDFNKILKKDGFASQHDAKLFSKVMIVIEDAEPIDLDPAFEFVCKLVHKWSCDTGHSALVVSHFDEIGSRSPHLHVLAEPGHIMTYLYDNLCEVNDV